MVRLCSILSLGMLTVGLMGCRQHQSALQFENLEPYVADASSVGFDIVPLPSGNGSSLWLATYSSQGKVAKFRFEIARPTGGDTDATAKIEFGKGSFQAVPGSDASVLLVDLAKALEAKTLPAHVQRVDNLPFTYAILGENQSQSSGEGFTSKPPGHWTAMKVFIGTGEDSDDGEVFFNFNAVTKKAQFSIKDSDYGNYLIAKLATVL